MIYTIMKNGYPIKQVSQSDIAELEMQRLSSSRFGINDSFEIVESDEDYDAIYNYNNPHPKKLIVGDCVKRAFTIATGKTYQEVSRELNRLKKVTRAKVFNNNKNWEAYLNQFNWKRVNSKDGNRNIRAFEFAKRYPTGTYFLRVRRHTMTMINGVIQDTWDSRNEVVYRAWRVA